MEHEKEQMAGIQSTIELMMHQWKDLDRFSKNLSSVAMEHEKEQMAGIQSTIELMMHQWKDLDRFSKNLSSVAMEHEKEQMAGIQSTIELMMHQWKDLDSHLQDFLEPKWVSLGDSVEESEKIESSASKLRELSERENEFLLKVRESELREREREEVLKKKQKMLDNRILKLKVQESVLAKRENENRSELEEIVKRESELQLGMKKHADLEKALDAKIISHEQDLKSAAKMKAPKRGCRASGSVRKVRQRVNQGEDGVSFSLTMSNIHETRNFVVIPASFTAAFDLKGKKRVILETNKGSYPHNVKQYISPARNGARIVSFRRAWNDLYRKNRLRIGMQCHFKLKEHAVDGDDSVFSMQVSVDVDDY